MLLRCDERERNGPIPFLPKLEFIKIETLHIGDYIISEGDNIEFLFERKTWSDLAASLKDGRYESQSRKMKELDCKKIIIIEGKIGYKRDTVISGIEFFKLDAARRKYIMEGYSVIQTKDAQATAVFLVDFFKQFEAMQIKTGSKCNISEAKTKKKKTIEEQRDEIWLSIKGIGPTLLPVIKEKYKLGDILAKKIQVAELAELKYTSGRKIGIKSAEKIIAYDDLTVLSAFQGISKDSAKYILKSHTVAALVQMPERELSEVYKSDSRRLGIIAENIISVVF